MYALLLFEIQVVIQVSSKQRSRCTRLHVICRALKLRHTIFVFVLSSGVGRTGAYITLGHALKVAKIDEIVDIPLIVTTLREQKKRMVQTLVRVVLLISYNLFKIASSHNVELDSGHVL